MLLSFSFNGVKKQYLKCEKGKRRSAWAPITRNLLSIPGLAGALLESTDTQVRVIQQPIFIEGLDRFDVRKLEEDLSAWLITDKAAELIFDDEQDRVYYAMIDGSLDIEDIASLGRGTITFICPDPYKYGPEVTETFPSDAVTLINKGTKDADPVFELEVLNPVTFALIQNQDNEYMMIGKPVDVESVPFTRLQTVLSDGCSTLVGWSAVPQGTALDTGIVGGTMKVHGGYAFTADTYGTNPNGWVGPAIKKSLSEPVQDFRAEVQLAAFNSGGQVGSIELHLIDENDNLIAVLAMRDATATRANNRAVVQLGSAGNRKTILDYYGDRPGTWNDFSGIIRLEREGTEFRVYVTELDANGKHVGRHTAQPFFDTLGDYQGRIAQVLVYDAKAKSYSTYSKLLHNIYIGKINQQTGIPYIANAGDVITFDHTGKGFILLNGEPRKDLKDFGADYFKLKNGQNSLILHPGESFNTSIRYRERYL